MHMAYGYLTRESPPINISLNLLGFAGTSMGFNALSKNDVSISDSEHEHVLMTHGNHNLDSCA